MRTITITQLLNKCLHSSMCLPWRMRNESFSFQNGNISIGVRAIVLSETFLKKQTNNESFHTKRFNTNFFKT